jgi:hypothetical protein
MSLLNQETKQELDDAARGEEFTKGTSHILWASLAATVVVTIAIAIYVISGQKPPVATGEVLEIWAHPMHTVTPAFDASGSPMSQETFDQVLVFTKVRLHSQSKAPLFLHQITTNVTLDDGIHTSYAAMPSQYERIFVAYPDLSQWKSATLSPDMTMEAGQTAEGTFVSSFRMTKQQWDSRKGLNYSFAFRYQPNVTINAKNAVIDR